MHRSAISSVVAIVLITALTTACINLPGTETPWGDSDYTDAHGIRVVENGYPVPRVEQFLDIDERLYHWALDIGPCARRSVRDWFLVWDSLPFYSAEFDFPLAGATYPALRTMRVGFALPLDETALLHEIDHVVAGKCLGCWCYGHEGCSCAF